MLTIRSTHHQSRALLDFPGVSLDLVLRQRSKSLREMFKMRFSIHAFKTIGDVDELQSYLWHLAELVWGFVSPTSDQVHARKLSHDHYLRQLGARHDEVWWGTITWVIKLSDRLDQYDLRYDTVVLKQRSKLVCCPVDPPNSTSWELEISTSAMTARQRNDTNAGRSFNVAAVSMLLQPAVIGWTPVTFPVWRIIDEQFNCEYPNHTTLFSGGAVYVHSDAGPKGHVLKTANPPTCQYTRQQHCFSTIKKSTAFFRKFINSEDLHLDQHQCSPNSRRIPCKYSPPLNSVEMSRRSKSIPPTSSSITCMRHYDWTVFFF